MAKKIVKPVVVTEENISAIVDPIVLQGYLDEKSEDEVKGELFKASVPFGKINAVFKASAIAQGLMVDPKVVADEIATEISESDWDAAIEWSIFSKFIDGITENVKGATRTKVLSAVKKYFIENEMKLPEEPKEKSSRSGGGKVLVAVANYFNSTNEPTKLGMYDVVLPLVKGQKNALDYVAMFFAFGYACKKGISLPSAISEVKSHKLPTMAKSAAVEVDDDNDSDDDDSQE